MPTGHSLSRRSFIAGGLASCGAFAGARLLPAAGLGKSGGPNLRLGVISDIHVVRAERDGEGDDWWENDVPFRRALAWFAEEGVDAVVIAGDLADNGLASQLRLIGEDWDRAFPNGLNARGRKVEKLFVYGNHDMAGVEVARWRPEHANKSDAELRPLTIQADPKKAWEDAFHEEFKPIWTKKVNGYRFVGAHWMNNGNWPDGERFVDGLEDWYARRAKGVNPHLPLFHIQHPIPKGTCYGPWAWGQDDGRATRALSRFPNAIALSGHSHYPLSDERAVWQGAFTSVSCGCLRYVSSPGSEFPGVGYENANCGDGEVSAGRLMPSIDQADCRHGMLWSVYDDCIVMRRREFVSGLDLGPDWVLPLPAAEPKPFAFAARARRLGTPQFAPAAKLQVRETKAKRRGGDRKELDAVEVVIPATKSDARTRLYRYDVAVSPGGLVKHVMANGAKFPSGHPKTAETTSCVFAREELPKGAVTFTVTPCNCFGAGGRPISAEWKS